MVLTLHDTNGHSRAIYSDVAIISGLWRVALEHRIELPKDEGRGAELSSSSNENSILVDDIYQTMEEYLQINSAS